MGVLENNKVLFLVRIYGLIVWLKSKKENVNKLKEIWNNNRDYKN